MRILLISLALTAASYAQEAVRSVSIRTVCFQKAVVSETVAGHPESREFIPCKLSTSSFSKPLMVKAPGGQIQFYKETPTEGSPPSVLVGTASIPAKINKAILLFVPNPNADKDKELYKIKVLDDSTATFAAGGALVVNLYQGDVRFIIGEHQKQLAAGQTIYLPSPQKKDEFNMASVAFQFRGRDGWKTASENRVRFTERVRHLLVTYIDQRSQRPRMRSYRDVLPDNP